MFLLVFIRLDYHLKLVNVLAIQCLGGLLVLVLPPKAEQLLPERIADHLLDGPHGLALPLLLGADQAGVAEGRDVARQALA